MAEIISILNLKGGVGKTTTAINLGKGLSILGKKVLVIDNDPQANLTRGVGITDISKTVFDVYDANEPLPIQEISKNFYATPAELRLATIENRLSSEINRNYKLYDAIEPFKNDLDYILIDCPPSVGVYTANALIASTKYLLMIQSGDPYSIEGLKNMEKMVNTEIKKRLNPTIECLGVLLSFVKRTNANDFILEQIKDAQLQNVLNSSIRDSISIKESAISGEDVFTYDSKSNGAIDYMNLAKELVGKK
ncbi:MAG: ParA family protein [Flammeovirgaceae bacterium]|nr:ParA family protein [Flammeovirgaceae bacterium]